MDAELVADAIAAENVRRLLRGEIIGEPEYGTLAWRVWRSHNVSVMAPYYRRPA